MTSIATTVAALEVRDLTKRYGGVPAVDGVSLSVERGVIGLLGPNGAGKTTLLRMLASVLRPDSGSIRLFGLDPANQGERVAGSATCRSRPGCTRGSRRSTSSTTSRS